MKPLKTAAFAVLLSASTLHAQGILFVQQESQGGKTSTNQIQIDKTRMRAESHSSGENVVFLFDSQKQVVRVVNVDKKSYVEMDRATMDQIGQRMGNAMAQMQEQMKNMPPEQRAMMEQMMRGRGGMPGMPPGGAPAKTTYQKTGSDKVGNWACTKYDGMRGTEKISEICAVDPREFGLTPADFEVAQQLAAFFKSATPPGMQQPVYFGTAEDQGFAGFPVRQVVFTNGKQTSVSEVKEFKREAFPASTFDVPSGYKKESIMGGMRQ